MNFFQRKYYKSLSDFYKKTGNDLAYARTSFKLKNNKELNLSNPQEFCDKIQWMKYNLYTEKYKDFVDKYEVRNFVETTIGGQYLNELIAVYDSVDAIDIDILPNQFALKATHGSGYNVIVSDKSALNWSEAKSKLSKFMKLNYFNRYRERIYKNIKPRIIAEKYLDQFDSDNIIDYKFYCIHGQPECIWVKTLDNGRYRNAYYSLDWERILPDNNKDFLSKTISKPKNLDEMIDLSKKLSANFIFVRVDLYSINDKVCFGELTFFPWSGNRRLTVEHLNLELGQLIKLPISN